MNRINTALTHAYLSIEQPASDAGPFDGIWGKIGGVLYWGATIIGLAAIVVAGALLAWERLDPTRDPVSGRAIIAAVVGGVIVAGSANIINWAYAS